MTLLLLAFAASLRTGSWNRKLLTEAVALARAGGAEVDLAEFREFDMPLYDGDLQVAAGIPAGAQRLIDRIAATDGMLLASPEYNYSMPGVLKNAIDWVSRARPMPLKGKSAMLLSASNGLIGGNRGLWALRMPLESLGVFVAPEMFSLAQADRSFEPDGGLADPLARQRLSRMVGNYLTAASALAGREPS